MDFFIRDDLYEAAKSGEDGEPIYGRIFYVVAQDKTGARWVHGTSYRDTVVQWCGESGTDRVERRTEACQAAAQRLMDRIVEAGGKIDLRLWIETDPEYGSAAYQEIDAVGGHRYAELRAAEDRGEIGVGQADRLFLG